jgi:hypothetical protein
MWTPCRSAPRVAISNDPVLPHSSNNHFSASSMPGMARWRGSARRPEGEKLQHGQHTTSPCGSGKLKRRSPVAVVSGGMESRQLHVRDAASGRSFLVNTGAEVSLIPASPYDKKHSPASNTDLVAANGSPIRTFGKRCCPLPIGGHLYNWSFIIAEVSQAILRADFLRDKGLLVDLRGRLLVNPATYSTIVIIIPESLSSCTGCTVSSPSKCQFSRLLTNRPVLTEMTFRRESVAHGVELHVDTGQTTPIRSPPRRLWPDKLAVAKATVKEMEDRGIVRSHWASPLHVAPKTGGGWRPCGNFCGFNGAIKTGCYPIPHIQDFTSQLAGKTIFSKIDLVKGYHQILVRQEDIHKTAVVTPFSLWEFL